MTVLDCSISLRTAGDKSCALALESLESRITPADFMWYPSVVIGGQVGNNWSLGVNWFTKNAVGVYVQQSVAVPGAGDNVLFPSNGATGGSLCNVNIAGGVGVASLRLEGRYTLVLKNPLTISVGLMACHADSTIEAGSTSQSFNVLTIANGAELDWRRGYFSGIDVNVTSASSMSVYQPAQMDKYLQPYDRNMANSRITISNSATLRWDNGDVHVIGTMYNSHLTIASGGRFIMGANGYT